MTVARVVFVLLHETFPDRLKSRLCEYTNHLCVESRHNVLIGSHCGSGSVGVVLLEMFESEILDVRDQSVVDRVD